MQTTSIADQTIAPRAPLRDLIAPAFALAAAAAIIGSLVLSGLGRPSVPGVPIDRIDQGALERAVGIRVERLAVTADGGLLDIRYRVVDAGRAMALHDADLPMRVTLEATGMTSERPWMGHGPSDALEVGHTYYMLLLNEGDLVKPGSVVSLEFAGVTLSHILIQ